MIQRITSKENDTVKRLKKLKIKKYRIDTFLVEGIKMVKEAVSEKIAFKTLIIREDLENDKEIKNIIEVLTNAQTKCNIIIVNENVLKEISDVENPQGICAELYKKEVSLIEKNNQTILALDTIQDPGNFGTIIRTADAAGIKNIIVSNDTVDEYNTKVVRSSMGSIYRVNIIKTDNLYEKLMSLKTIGYEILTTSLDATQDMYEVDYESKIIVIGNEGSGVSKEILDASDIKIKIPMIGRTESLNAAVACSVVLYEKVRQELIKLD